jgi:pyruvate/2-oxoglutarate dehydrogenase complex dihydrolipoamide dehydrogenase (E3) component
MNSDDFFLMEELPKKMIVIGGGYIGMEMASIMRAMGVEVTIVCRSIPLKFVD